MAISIYEEDLAKAQEMDLEFYQSFSYAVVHVGDTPAESIASVVGHEQTIVHERPEVAPDAPALQEDFWASGDRLLDTDQKQRRPDLFRNCVDSILQAPNEDELEKELLQYQQQGTETGQRTAELRCISILGEITCEHPSPGERPTALRSMPAPEPVSEFCWQPLESQQLNQPERRSDEFDADVVSFQPRFLLRSSSLLTVRTSLADPSVGISSPNPIGFLSGESETPSASSYRSRSEPTADREVVATESS